MLDDDPGAEPVPLARPAVFLARNLDRRLGAVRRFLEADLEVVAQVGSALRAAAAPPAAAAEQVAEPEHVAEDVGEVAELGGRPTDRSRRRRLPRCCTPAWPKPVVGLALLGVGEDAHTPRPLP